MHFSIRSEIQPDGEIKPILIVPIIARYSKKDWHGRKISAVLYKEFTRDGYLLNRRAKNYELLNEIQREKNFWMKRFTKRHPEAKFFYDLNKNGVLYWNFFFTNFFIE